MNITIDREDKITKDDFAFYLTNMREYLGVTRKDFAGLLKIPLTSYYTYEQGKSLPKNWNIIKERIVILVKEKSLKIKQNDDLNSLLNDSLKEGILELHSKGKNTVQIGVLLSLEECLVSDYLLSMDIEPIYYKLYD